MALTEIKRMIPSGIKKALLAAYCKIKGLCFWWEKQYTKLFVKTCRLNLHKVVFDNFFGRGYGDNPKYIADELLLQKDKWDLVWLVTDLSIALPTGVRAVKYGSYKAMREMASAKYFVDNVRNSKRPEKKGGQIYLQTWHGGLGFKAVEGAAADRLHSNYVAAAQQDGRDCDGIISECGIQSDEFRACFWLADSTQILEVGLPRNDKLFDEVVVSETAQKVRMALGIGETEKTVLYMPTFRDDRSTDGYELDYHGVLSAFENRFGGKFVMMVRMHPNVKNQDSFVRYDAQVLNATHYPDAQELYMAADFLITDYSSAAFDFSLLWRPVILCALDYAKYQNHRGLTDIFQRCSFPKVFTNSELKQCIEGFSYEDYFAAFDVFRQIWQPFDQGDAARQIVDWMRSKS